jgi:mevalonate kinase
MKKKLRANYIDIIKMIQNTRSKNNINWMDILKIAYKNDPKSTKLVVSRINKLDKKISNLFKKLS